MAPSALVLRQLTAADEAAFMRAFLSWKDPGFIFAHGFEEGMKFSEYLALLADYARGEQLPPGYVASTTLCGFVDGAVVGRLNIRHRLNGFLLKIGGHIGYGVVTEFRRRGYATEMLKQSLPVARQLGIARALLTCDDNNVGSIKTIEGCGGILENKVDAGPDKPLKRRYWITGY